MKCKEKIWVQGLGRGYAGNMECGVEMVKKGDVVVQVFSPSSSFETKEVWQCPSCKNTEIV